MNKKLKGIAYSAYLDLDIEQFMPSKLLMRFIVGVLICVIGITLINSFLLMGIRYDTDKNTEFLAPIRKAQECQKTSKTQEEFDECIK